MQIFFASDVHGSEICWKKFINAGKFYEADTLILGGDMTGKAVVPIIAQGGERYKVTLLDQESILEGGEKVAEMVKTIQNRGYYPYVTDPDEVAEISSTPGRSDDIFLDEVLKTIRRWLEYADEKLNGTGIRCFVCPGNDDMFAIDDVIATSKSVENVEGRLIQLDDHHEMINTGWTNPTPWDTHREEDDQALLARIEAIASQLQNPRSAVFNLHAPPYGSGLDEAPELTKDLRLAYAGQSLISVGSKAVLEVVEKYQPMLGLFGHIHEGKGTRKYRKTLCINPGSMYEQGILQGALIDLKPNKVGNYILTTG
ncbi:MAG: metallophosphoesterase [Chloroflexi bacterium]|nr:metallophosphoesterase [Chloroflexota bacterium]